MAAYGLHCGNLIAFHIQLVGNVLCYIINYATNVFKAQSEWRESCRNFVIMTKLVEIQCKQSIALLQSSDKR